MEAGASLSAVDNLVIKRSENNIGNVVLGEVLIVCLN